MKEILISEEHSTNKKSLAALMLAIIAERDMKQDSLGDVEYKEKTSTQRNRAKRKRKKK